MDVQQRQAAVAVLFGEEEEQEEEEDITGSYVGNKVGTWSGLLRGNRSWYGWCFWAATAEEQKSAKHTTWRCYSHHRYCSCTGRDEVAVELGHVVESTLLFMTRTAVPAFSQGHALLGLLFNCRNKCSLS